MKLKQISMVCLAMLPLTTLGDNVDGSNTNRENERLAYEEKERSAYGENEQLSKRYTQTAPNRQMPVMSYAMQDSFNRLQIQYNQASLELQRQEIQKELYRRQLEELKRTRK